MQGFRKVAMIVTAICGGLGVIVLAISAVLYFINRNDLASRATATGNVLKLVDTTETTFQGMYFRQRPVVQFKTADGQSVEFISYTNDEPGDAVDVVYNPKKPDDARVYSFFGFWFTTLALFVMALLLLAMAVGFFVVGVRSPS